MTSLPPLTAPILPPDMPGVRDIQVVGADETFQANEVSVARAVGELLRVVRESLDLEVIFVGEITEGRRYFRHVNTSLSPAPVEVGGSHPLDETICQRILDRRVPAYIPNVQAIAQEQQLTAEVSVLTMHIGVPVHLPDGRLYGMLCGFNLREGGTLDGRDLKRMEIAAGAAARLLAQADGSAVDGGVRIIGA